jgi:hypothetical protein
VTELGARSWLLALTCLAVVWGLIRRNKIVFASIGWIIVLVLIGSAYHLGVPFLNITNMGAVLIMLYLPIGLILGAAAEEGIEFLDRYSLKENTIKIAIPAILILGYVFSHIRGADIEPYRYFVTAEDVAAMQWINENTPPDSLFAVNTFFWLPQAPHGTDAGYWIPYFTGRDTTTSAMIFSQASMDYREELVEMSHLEEQLEVDNSSIDELAELGVDYVYIGKMGDFSGPGLDEERLIKSDKMNLVFNQSGIFILRIDTSE